MSVMLMTRIELIESGDYSSESQARSCGNTTGLELAQTLNGDRVSTLHRIARGLTKYVTVLGYCAKSEIG